MDRPEREAEATARTVLCRPLARFARDRKGVAAIEFAILAFPFFLLVFAILECCIAFAAQELMTNATDDVARRLRTGQLKASEIDQDEVHRELCERMSLLFRDGCPELKFDLRSYDSFEDAAREYDSGPVPSQYRFDPGPALSKNMLRVFYPWPVYTDILRERISSPDGEWLLFATTTWQNEPFDD